MAASKYDFSVEQGSSYKLSLKYKDNDGNTLSLAGYCARLMASTNTGQTLTFLSTDAANSDYKFYIDETNGLITLLLSAHYTNSINFSSAKYDLELKSPQDLYDGGGKYTIRLLSGTITVVKRFSKTNDLLDCSL